MDYDTTQSGWLLPPFQKTWCLHPEGQS